MPCDGGSCLFICSTDIAYNQILFETCPEHSTAHLLLLRLPLALQDLNCLLARATAGGCTRGGRDLLCIRLAFLNQENSKNNGASGLVNRETFHQNTMHHQHMNENVKKCGTEDL